MQRTLYEQLRCRPTDDFAVAALSGRSASALITDDYGFAWRETSALAEMIEVNGPGGRPPLSYHGLHREGRLAWVHPRRDRRQLALARVFRFDEFDYASDSMAMAVAHGFRGAPIFFAAVDAGVAGIEQIKSIHQAGLEMISLRRVAVLDLRGAYPRTHELKLRKFGEMHPILELEAGGESALAAAG